MRFGDGGGEWVEIAPEEVQPPVPGYSPGGDVRVRVAARWRNFTGTTSQWIEAARWLRFMQDLQDLERTRRGEAHLESTGRVCCRCASSLATGWARMRSATRASTAPSPSASLLSVDPSLLAPAVSRLRAAISALE